MGEDNRIEFKAQLTEGLEKEVVAFVNKEGGSLYIGVDDAGK
ncbi:MAG: AlbA family DNA-binding domain-containing protein [Aureispira sp.]